MRTLGTDQVSIYVMKTAEGINTALDQLPKAELCDIKAQPYDELVKDFKVVRVTDHVGKVTYVDAPTDSYNCIQHAEAFRPVIEGLTQAGIRDWRFILYANPRRASLQIYVGRAGFDTVSLGFNVQNSFNRSKALSFGFKMNKVSKFIEIVGYRQVCSNGMKIRVPLEEAEIIKRETRIQIETLIKERTRIKHTAGANAKLELIQYTVEALSLLQAPVEAMIKRGILWQIKHEELMRELVMKHVSKRYQNRVIAQYNDQKDNTLWGLYNAITYVASHDPTLKDSGREKLLDAGANLLLEKPVEVTA